MSSERKPPSLVDLCIRTVIDNLRHVGCVDGLDMHLLKRILPHCNIDQLSRIESRTEMDLSSVTDVLWKVFYRKEFGVENMNDVIRRMKQGGVQYKWKDLYKAKAEKQQDVVKEMAKKLKEKYQEETAKKQSKQIKICNKLPPTASRKRSFFGVSGPGSISNYKSPILQKARMEVNSRAKMQATVRRNILTRPSQSARPSSSQKPTSTIRPAGFGRPIQNKRPKL